MLVWKGLAFFYSDSFIWKCIIEYVLTNKKYIEN
jgi:hypothetical protein